MKNRIATLIFCAGILAGLPKPSSAQWQFAGYPGECKVTALALAGKRVFAGTYAHGVYASMDQGATWEAFGSGWPRGDKIDDLAAGENVLFAISAGRVFVSTSRDARWRPACPESSRGSYFNQITVCGRTVVAGTGKSLLISEDDGEHWRAAKPGLPREVWSNCILARGRELYAGTNKGVFVSEDRGDTWRQVVQDKSLGLQVNCMDLLGNEIIVGTSEGVYTTADGTSAWKYIGDKRRIITNLLASGRTLYVGTWRGLYISTDAGESLRLVDSRWAQTQVTALVADQTRVYVGMESGLFWSGDGGLTWTSAGPGLPLETSLYPLVAVGKSLYAGAEVGVWLSTDGGEAWRPIRLDIPVEGLVAWGPDLVASKQSNVSILRPHETTWEINRNPWNLPDFSLDVGAQEIREGGECWYSLNSFYASFSYSRDGGKSWSKVYLPVRATCVYASGSDLFAGTGDRPGKGGDRDAAARATNSIFLSLDGGKKWQRSSVRFSASINDLAAIGTDLYIGTDRGLYACGDFGRCSKASKLVLPEEVKVKLFKVIGNKLIVGTSRGVYIVKKKDDRGGWTALNTKFPKELVPNSFAVIGRDLFASTAFDGVWRYVLPRD